MCVYKCVYICVWYDAKHSESENPECMILFSSKKVLKLNNESTVDDLVLWNMLAIHCFVSKFGASCFRGTRVFFLAEMPVGSDHTVSK